MALAVTLLTNRMLPAGIVCANGTAEPRNDRGFCKNLWIRDHRPPTAPMDLLSRLGLRTDGRRSDELRRISCKMGVFNQPDGSTYLEQGNTKVLAAVNGRTRLKAHNDCAVINCQYSMATFSRSERKRRPRDNKSAELTVHLKQAMTTAIKTDLYPKSQIDIFVEVYKI
ncbi:exosome complex component RRP41-like isoform X2 [Sipha flava]|uniref:Exosome complex component RRP41-like isoform X2 n=1 Tax=Sipha flava TaxID=143950 RepID=A0A8B8F5B3_9HEMI|nr:exosome complex component RRP41-like isoform X2 [Sipha flava]